jgi:phage shock protein PspC (stress-responsive transcriptional regulator)
VFAGVCGGLAAQYGWDALWTRLGVFLLLVFTFPVGLLTYVVLGFAMPKEPKERSLPRYWSGPAIKPVAWRGPRRIALFLRYLVPTALVIGGGWYLALYVSHRSGPEEATAAFFTLVLGVGLSIGFLAGDRVQHGTNGGARGWHAMGILFVALAILMAAAREVAYTGLADELLRELPGSMREKMEFVRSQASILIPFGIFVAGATCCVVGRRALGWAHVARGIVGWGTFLAIPILGLMSICRASVAWGGIIQVEEQPAGQLAALLLTGCVGAVLLAWRSRAARQPVASPLATGQEMAA